MGEEPTKGNSKSENGERMALILKPNNKDEEAENSRRKAHEKRALEINLEKMPWKMINNKICKEPLKVIYQNIRGLITENSKAKKEYFEEFVKENNVMLINFTETWLNKTIQDDANINEYQCLRVDRKDATRGGAAIYIRDELEAKIISKVNSGKCEMIAINIEHLNTINIVIYRPPDTTFNIFTSIIQELKNILECIKPPEPNIIITGDFNFPFIKWIREPCNGCRWEYITSATTDEKSQFINLMLLLDKFNIIQSIEEPTRGNNTLDLVFTNNIDMFIDIGVTESLLSDHNIIEISTSYNVNKKISSI